MREGNEALEEPLTTSFESPILPEAMTSLLLYPAGFRHSVCGCRLARYNADHFKTSHIH